MTQPLSYEVNDNIAIVKLNSPPVNALGHAVRQGIVEGFEKAGQDKNVEAIVLICDGRTFFAGADIREFGKPPQEPNLRLVIETIEASKKLTIAAIHGTALGGGLETALGCHYRIALPSARVGLPEAMLGLLPGAGGTQKLPRLVGVAAALEIITSGRQIQAQEALNLNIVDKICNGEDLLAEALTYGRQLIADNAPRTLTLERDEKIIEAKANPEIFSEFRQKNARKLRGFKAKENIIKSIQAAVELPFDQAMVRERELFTELFEGRDSHHGRRHYYEFSKCRYTRDPA